MNLQTHCSGQTPGQVLNHVGTALPGLTQQNRNPSQMQNSYIPCSASGMDPEIVRSRRYMQEQILEFLKQGLRQSHEVPTKNMINLAKHLEECLFRSAKTKEEYLNLESLKNRLLILIDSLRMSNHNQQLAHANSHPYRATMIPTPGFQQTGNSSAVGGQNSHILHNIGGHMGDGTGSKLQQRSFGSSNGPLNSPGTEGHLEGMVSEDSTTSLDLHFDQHPQPVLQGDGYGIGAADDSGFRNVCVPVTSVGAMMNIQCLNPISSQSTLNRNSPLMANNQSNAYSAHHVMNMKPEITDQPEKVNLQSQYSVKENLAQCHQHLKFQQPYHEFQNRQLIQNQVGQNEQMRNQHLLKSVSFSHSPLSSNIISGANFGIGTGHHDEGLQSQVSNPFQFSDMQKQYQRNSMEDHSGATLLFPHSCSPQDVHSSPAQTSEQMQQVFANTRSDLTGLCGGIQPDAALHGQWYSKSEDVPLVSGLQLEQNVQDEFYQQFSGQCVAQLNNLSSGESMFHHCNTSRSAEPLKTSNSECQFGGLAIERLYRKQQMWLLFLKHARKCSAPEGKCHDSNCLTVQKLWKHLERCNLRQCTYPRCHASRALINHHRNCHDARCPVCIPVKSFVQSQKARFHFNSGLPGSVDLAYNSRDTAEIVQKSTPMVAPVIDETPKDPPVKRMKFEQGSQSLVLETEYSAALASSVDDCHVQDAQDTEQHHDHIPRKYEITELNMEVPRRGGQLSPNTIEMKDNLDDAYVQSPEADPVAPNNPAGLVVGEAVKTEKKIGHSILESTAVLSENASKSQKSKIVGVSMIELFTRAQACQHISSLRQWVGQSKAKAEKNQALAHSRSENSCQLCAVEKLTFEPPPMYCTPCGTRIKRNAVYYTFGSGEACHCFCIPCYNGARGDTIVVGEVSIPKVRVAKKKNDKETEEGWVQCDKCEAWQHQICALFNGRRNDGGQAEYTCPNCYMAELDRGERVPLPQSAVLGAEDLPRTNLSDHLEQRLFAKLKQEREDRARLQGRSYDEVPGAEALVVRVVSSVDRKLDVKPCFLEIFQDRNYPTEFPYKSKVILLFQRIEGVEVCLFGMYVQEFGAECQQPNNRRVYLSYLDSVKYFQPVVTTVTGEALRTFVYHEILIGYLEHCKRRGFTSCYIWACPPLKGEDYILYCHPEIQKTPKSDKLREWYLAMLRKATKENIVVNLTNLYEHFFVSNGECKATVTAARLPNFDGDYWPGAAEDIIYQLQQDDDGRKQHKKGIMKKSITKRALQASGQTDLSGNASKDVMLMHKLGETISPMKEDFIMVHLQHPCSHCRILMVSGNRWVCRECKYFQLCDKCYDAERIREGKERHPINQKDKHALYPVEISGVPDGTQDNEILESEFFDTRHAFLSLCQGNHYQYDTLRRAKHSSMMVLYHLHNPTAPAFVTQCATCHLDIETGQGWRCETCPDYDVCNACYQKDGGIDHPHRLTNQQSNDHIAQNKEARKLRVMQLRRMLDLLVHASQCRSPHCQYQNCRKVKALFRHGMMCKIRASGGCPLCKKMWYLLQLHARACKESPCFVPRCRDLKEHMRRLQQQSDSRRRAAVMEMMRERAAELGSNSQ